MITVSQRQQKNERERKISACILESEPKPNADEAPPKSSLQNQIIASLICSLGAFTSGCSLGWSSPALPELRAAGELSEHQSAWAAGILPLGALVSSPIFCYFARTKGRKPAAYLIGIPLALGFLLISFKSPILLITGRFMCGLGAGGALSLPPLYIGEICEPRARGFLSSIMMVEFNLGMLFTYTMGAFLPDIHILPLTILPVPLTFLLLFCFMPETPIYLLRLGKEEEAARALAWSRKLPLNSREIKEELTQLAERLGLKLPLPVRPTTSHRLAKRQPRYNSYLRSPSRIESKKPSVEKELEMLQDRHVDRAISRDYNNRSPLASWRILKNSPAGYRGLTLCFALMTMQTFMGIIAVSNYAESIFASSGSALSPDICAIFYAVVVVFGTIVTSLLIEKVGRRVLQISSCLIVGACHLILASSFEAIANKSDHSWLKWLPLFALMLCVFGFNTGAGVIPFVIVSEIFAPEVRDIATNVMMMYLWITSFTLLQCYPFLVRYFGLHVMFYGFAAVSLLGAGFCYFALIETKGKTLEEILQLLSGKSNGEREIDDADMEMVVVDVNAAERPTCEKQ